MVNMTLVFNNTRVEQFNLHLTPLNIVSHRTA